MRFLLFVAFFLFLSNLVFSQDYKDCNSAIQICNESPLHIDVSSGIGTLDTAIENTCVNNEINSIWINWSILQSGMLTFVLTPDNENQDLDFIVFKIPTSNDCNGKELLRCMASGETIGSSSQNCMGPTGLAIGETDFVENPGCNSGDNNFLAPLDVVQGESYALLVNNFHDTNEGFTINFGGDAVLDCNSLPTTNLQNKSTIPLRIIPSHSAGEILIELSSQSLLGAQLSIFDMFGRLIFFEKSISELTHQIKLNRAQSGFYIARLEDGIHNFTKRFYLSK